MGYFRCVLEIFALVALLNIDSISSREDYTLYELAKDHFDYRIGLGGSFSLLFFLQMSCDLIVYSSYYRNRGTGYFNQHYSGKGTKL